ncbi:hypothetical protein K435DRAFT_516624 [Dendrothele bispora CBS 962.96]|uniref:Uncharacterized protein n=1 Tax=Dendrothele bispora (strain CBS 962.96) TaxID=1314807 RepID=A0A4V4HBL1_DENBC|nr:hypothetical protein K435DRAFT_516624 [Dendrothele bispora CBS 962.96]
MLGHSIKPRIQSIRMRIVRNPLTTTFFLVSLIHCIAQGIIQSLLFSLDVNYNSFTSTIINEAHVPQQNHTDLFVTPNSISLQMCNFIPHSNYSCSIVFDSKSVNISGNDVDSNPEHDSTLRGEKLTHFIADGAHFLSDTTNALEFLRIESPSEPGDPIILSQQCVQTLVYPDQHFQNSRREDIALIVLQLWLFGVSVLAMYYDSVPHILAGLILHILFTTWSIYAFWRTKYQKDVFNLLIEEPATPCSTAVFSPYFENRVLYETYDLVLNITAFLLAAYLSWHLVRGFSKKSVQRLDAPENVKAIYKYFLAIQVCLQMAAFVLSTWMGLWLDQIQTSYILKISNHLAVYRAMYIFYTVLLLPWMLAGWWGIRLEKRKIVAVFTLTSFVLIVIACVIFYSQVFRWTFIAWPFFGGMTVLSLVLLVAIFALSIICRANFGKGLAQYLYADSALASSNFTVGSFKYDIENAQEDSHEDMKRSSFVELGL